MKWTYASRISSREVLHRTQSGQCRETNMVLAGKAFNVSIECFHCSNHVFTASLPVSFYSVYYWYLLCCSFLNWIYTRMWRVSMAFSVYFTKHVILRNMSCPFPIVRWGEHTQLVPLLRDLHFKETFLPE